MSSIDVNWKTQNISNKYIAIQNHPQQVSDTLYFICVLQAWQESNWVLKFP